MIDRIIVCSHVMHIVAMEMYYVLKNQMDKELTDVLKKFAKEGYYSKWTKVRSCDCHVTRILFRFTCIVPAITNTWQRCVSARL